MSHGVDVNWDGVVLPVLRPKLPDAERLLPYLRRIDASRVYANWGPLTAELESRLAGVFGVSATAVCSAASGTTALVGAILSSAGRATPERPLALMPAFTFVATALAAEQCGYTPYFVDVRRDSWQLDPNALGAHPHLARAGVVIPVAPYGRGVPQQGWSEFRSRAGVPVVIDGGASFEALVESPGTHVGEVPVALSFHATKSFSTGEGGGIVTTDPACQQRLVQVLNFGFFAARSCECSSTNGKMSEYHAAVGLAELDGWSEKRQGLQRVADRYRAEAHSCGCQGLLTVCPEVASSYVLLDPVGGDAASVSERLASAGIESRLWYGDGVHRQPHFRSAGHDDLEVTARLASLVGLPVAPDLPDAHIHRVLRAVGQRGTR